MIARLLLAAAGVGVGSGLLMWVTTPSGADLDARVQAQIAPAGAQLLATGDIPQVLAEAIVATEDERFYVHHGIDIVGLARAVVFDVSEVCLCQGGSTITEQLVKDVYLGGSDNGLNKLADMTLAVKVELQFSKAQILAAYLSEVPTGAGLVGMPAAACIYFGQRLDQLDLAAAALLAGLPQAPSAYDPRLHQEAALARRSEVLDAMVDDGYVTSAMARQADSSPLLPAARRGTC